MNSERLARLLASGFGIGFCPVAPGTVASLVAIGIGALLLSHSIGLLAFACGLVCLTGIWAVRKIDAGSDPGWVVIDEFAGQWIAQLAIDELNWKNLLFAFLLFRFFDIVKPQPVAWADERHDALGVMADDMIAGTMAALVMAVFFWQFPDLLD